MAKEKKVTVDEMSEQNPEMVKEVAAAIAAEIEALPTDKFKAKFPKLYSRLDEEITHANKPANLNIEGFMLAIDDPFAAGALRQYAKSRGIAKISLPYVLPFAEKRDTTAALGSYLMRAAGAGDRVRVAAVQAALEKLSEKKQ